MMPFEEWTSLLDKLSQQVEPVSCALQCDGCNNGPLSGTCFFSRTCPNLVLCNNCASSNWSQAAGPFQQVVLKPPLNAFEGSSSFPSSLSPSTQATSSSLQLQAACMTNEPLTHIASSLRTSSPATDPVTASSTTGQLDNIDSTLKTLMESLNLSDISSLMSLLAASSNSEKGTIDNADINHILSRLSDHDQPSATLSWSGVESRVNRRYSDQGFGEIQTSLNLNRPRQMREIERRSTIAGNEAGFLQAAALMTESMRPQASFQSMPGAVPASVYRKRSGSGTENLSMSNVRNSGSQGPKVGHLEKLLAQGSHLQKLLSQGTAGAVDTSQLSQVWQQQMRAAREQQQQQQVSGLGQQSPVGAFQAATSRRLRPAISVPSASQMYRVGNLGQNEMRMSTPGDVDAFGNLAPFYTMSQQQQQQQQQQTQRLAQQLTSLSRSADHLLQTQAHPMVGSSSASGQPWWPGSTALQAMVSPNMLGPQSQLSLGPMDLQQPNLVSHSLGPSGYQLMTSPVERVTYPGYLPSSMSPRQL